MHVAETRLMLCHAKSGAGNDTRQALEVLVENVQTARRVLPVPLALENIAALFDWPFAPRTAGGVADLQRFSDVSPSSAYTAHLMSATRQHAFFVAFSPTARLAFGYVWTREDFPWLGIWRENRSRSHVAWNGATVACGMEFGASPMPETRREMIERGRLFDVPTFRWIPARTRVEVVYWAIARDADVVPDTLASPAP
jgi:hypothetical protein